MTPGLREQIAAFRYSLIAPVVSRQTPLSPGEIGAYLRETSAQEYVIPGNCQTRVSVRTLERYLALYRKGGYDALMPKVRNDKGNIRLSEDVLKRAVTRRRVAQDCVFIAEIRESLKRHFNIGTKLYFRIQVNRF